LKQLDRANAYTMTPSSPDAHYTQSRHVWETGTFSDVTTLRFAPEGLTFARIDQYERAVKLREVAYLRAVKARARGVQEPRLILFARLEQDRAAADVFTGIDARTDAGELLTSANSLITYTLRGLLARGWLRHSRGDWSTAIPDDEPAWRARAHAVLAFLTHQNRLCLCGALGRPLSTSTAFEGFDTRRDLLPVDRLGFVREFVWRERPRIAFNTAFFLLEHDDFFSHHSALGEAYNLWVRDGVILRPPLYRRGAFYQTAEGRWHSGRFSLADMTLRLPDGTDLVPAGSGLPGLPFTLNPDDAAQIAVYTRACGLVAHGHPLRRTPTAARRVEFTVVDTRVVGCATGGGLDIPQNGLVLSFAADVLPAESLDHGLPRVRYGFAHQDQRGIQQAIQAGPMLLKGGQIVISAGSLAQEEFWPTPLGHTDLEDAGVVPTDYPDDVDRTRAGRIGLGVDDQNRLIVVAVPGTERGTHRPQADSSGATLLELAEWLAQAGAVDAINLDGGGSTQLFYRGGLATVPGNRYGMPGLQVERLVPAAGVWT